MVYDFGSDNRVLEERHGIDLSALMDLYDHLALFQNGEGHKALRQHQLRLITELRPLQMERLEESRTRIPRIFDREGPLDIVADFLVPFYNDIWRDHINLTHDAQENLRDFFILMDPNSRISARRRVNAMLREVIPDDRSDDWLDLFSLYFMGRMALVGGFALTLWNIWKDNLGTPMSQIAWPSEQTDTSVKQTHRIVTRDVKVRDQSFQKGEVVCCHIDPRINGHAPDRELGLFGAGQRLCLGRPLTLAVWNAMVEEFGRLDIIITPRGDAPPPIAHPLDAPRSMIVDLVRAS